MLRGFIDSNNKEEFVRNADFVQSSTSDTYMSIGEAYSHLNNMFKAYEAETDAVKKQRQGMDAINFQNTLNAAIADPSMPYYNPYTRATNYNIVDNLKKYYNIDLSNGITQSTINDLKKNVDYSRISYNYGGSIASNTKDANQQLAYYIAMLEDDEAITQKAESELQSLQNDVWMMVQQGYSDNDISRKIDMSKYPTLSKMDEGKRTNAPLTLNRRVNYSQDYLPAYIWAARNDYQLKDDDSYVMALIGSNDGVGNVYKPNSKSYASLDPSSEYFAPYSQATTLFELGSKYHTSAFDSKWLETHKSKLLNGDSTAQKDYQKIATAVETADKAAQELEKLNRWRNAQLKGKSADEVVAMITRRMEDGTFAEDYPTLASMENKRRRGAALELGYSVDFSMPIFEAQTRKMEQTRQTEEVEDAEADTNVTPTELNALRAAAGVTTETESVQPTKAPEQPTEKVQASEEKRAIEAPSAKEEPKATEKPAGKSISGSTSTAPFSVIAFKESLAGKSAVEQNTAMSNLEDEIAAYKNGTPMENLSEEAQSFISSNKELFGGRQYYEKQHYDETEKVYYDSRQNTLTQTFWNDTFTSTGVGEEVANAIQRADVGVEDGVLTPEDNAAFLIGIAEAKEKAKAAGLTLEAYMQSDKAAYDSTIGVLDETLEKNRAEMEVYQQKVQDEFVAQYSAAQANTWNGNASDDDTRLMRQINTFNVDFSKDVVYADASIEVNDYVQELLYENGYSYEEDYSKKTAVSSWMEFGTGSASIVSGNVQQAAMSVYNEDMRAARYLGFKNLTEFYERYPELEARAQKRAEAAADEKIDEYNSAVEEFNELYQNAMQASSKGKSTVEHDGETYDVLDAIEIARNSVGQIMTEDSERYKSNTASEFSGVEPAPEEERWGLIEAPVKVAWKSAKSGLVSVPLSFADAIDYYFYTNTQSDIEAYVRSNMTRAEYRAMIEYAVSDESGVIPDENRRKALRTKLYGDEELGIAAYSGDIYDFGYDVSREDILKYIESREKYLQGNRDDVAKYAPGYLDGYDTMVSAVDNIARMGVVMGLTAATGGGGVASFAASGVAYGVTEGATFGRLLEDKFGLSHDKAAAWSVLYGAGITAMESFMFDKLESGAMKGVDEDNFASYGRNAVRDWIKKGSLNPSNARKNFAWFGGKATEFTLSTLSESLQEGGEALWQNAVVSIATKDTEILPGETYTPEAFWGTTVDAIPVSAILTLVTGAIGDSQLGRWAKKYEKQTAITYEQAQLGVEAAKADLEALRTKVETEGWQGIVDQNKVEEYTLNRFLESLDGIKNSAESQQAAEAQQAVEEQKQKRSKAQQEYDAAQARAQQEAESLMNEEIPSTDTIASMQDAQAELDKHADALKKENELLDKAQTTASEKQAQLDAIKQQAFNEAQAAAEQRVRQEHAEEEILQKQKRVEEEQQKVDEYLNETSKAIAESLEEEGARGNPDAIKSKILKYGENFSKYIGTQQERLSKQFANSVPGWKLQFDTFSDAGTQGYVDKNSKTIHLSNGITMMEAMRATIGHELTHILEGLPDYAEIRDAIFDGYYNGDVDKIQSDLQAIENRYNKQADETGNEGFRLDTDEKQRQELFGDLVGQVLFKADPYVINRIASQNQSVVRKIFRKISDLVKSLGIRLSRDGGKEAARAYRELSRMRDTFAEALSRASGLEQQTGSVDVAGMQQVGERVEAPVDTLTAEDVLRQKAPVQEEITVEQEAPAQQEEVVAENETTNVPVEQEKTKTPTAAQEAQTQMNDEDYAAANTKADAKAYAPVDGSDPKFYTKRKYDFRKSEREGKQITIENVNDAQSANRIIKLLGNDSIPFATTRIFTNNPDVAQRWWGYIDYQVKANSVSEYIEALKNPDVDNVVFEGQNASTMPTFYYKDGSWHVDFSGVTEQQRALANAIEAEGLEMAYAMKSPIERTTENADYVSNRNAGSRAMWSVIAEEKQEAKAQAEKERAAQEEQRKATLDTPVDGKLAPETPTAIKERVSNLLTTEAAPEIVKVADIQVDPETYQFKGDVNEQGVTKPLTGDYKPGLSQPLILHERLDGTLYVADGHHRLDLAKRNGVDTVSAVVLKEADGYTPADVRVYAALRNLSQGRGTSIDAAKLFRDAEFTREELAEYGLSTNETIVEQGMNIANLSEDAFNRVVNGEIPVYAGALMGEMFADDVSRQNTFLKEMHGKNLTQQEQRYLAEDIQRAVPVEREGEQLAFDDALFQQINTNLAERAQIVSGLKNRLAKEANQFSTLSKQKTVDKVSAVGQNVLDAEANKAHAQTAQAANALLSTYHLTGETNQQVRAILDKYATELATNPKMSKNAAINAAYNEIMAIAEGGMTSEVRGSQKADDATSDRAGLEGQGGTGKIPAIPAEGRTGGVLEGGRGTVETAQGGKNLNPQYSVRFDEDERLDALISFARDNNAADLLQDLYGKKLRSLFGSRDTRTSFEQVNPVRILKTLAANLGTQIYTADIKDDVIMGYYDQAARAIVVDENSLSNLRVGLFGIGQYVYDAIGDKFKLRGITRFDFFREFAEYMTHATDDVNPMFRSNLRSLVNEKMFKAIEDARAQIIMYSSLSDVQQTMNRVRDRYEERAGKKSMRRLIRDFYINNVNAPFAANTVDRITGTDALSLAARYLPYAKRMSDSILTREYVRPDGSNGGASFADVLQNAGVTTENQQKVFTYMLLQHEQETRNNTRTRRNSMTGEIEVVEAPIYIFPEKTLYQEEIEMAEIEQQIPGVENMAKSIRAWWTQFMQDWYVNEGFMPQEKFAEWQTKYANYVPHFRFGKEGTDGTVKRSKGSGRDVINPLDTYVEYIQSIVNRAQQNRVARTFHQLYQTNSSMSAIAKYVPVSGVDEYKKWSQDIQAYLDLSNGFNPADVFDNMAKMTRKKGSDGQNLTVYLENGAIVRYEITDPSLYNLLSGRDGRNLNTFARGLKRVTNTFARLTTGINPMFSVKNAIRDMQHSINWGSWASNYGSGIAKWMENFVYTADNYIKEQRGLKTDKAYAQYRALGGGESERYNTRDYKSVKGLRKELLGQNPTTFEAAKSIVWKALTWEDLNNIIEMNSRLIEYRFGKQETKTLEGRKRAFMNAQEATVDFQRRGLGGVGSFLSAAIPFFNATVQGIDQQVRMFSSGERSRLGTRLAKTAINNALMGVLQVLMVGVFGDDDDKEGYSWLLDSTKNDFFLFPLHWIDNDVARGFVRLPLAQDALSKGMFAFGRNLAAGTLGEEYQDEFSVDLLKTAYDIILDQIPDTSIFSSFIDVLLNQTWYGTQMESDYKQKLSEVNRTNTNMPEFFNMLAQRLSAMGAHGKFASPIMLKYLFQQNTGVIGQFLIPMLSPDANGNLNPLRAFWTTWRNSLTLEPAYTNKVRGTYDELSTIIETTIYDGNAGLIGGQLKPGLTSAEAAEAYEQALDFQNGLIKRTDQAVAQIYGEINSINANETLSASEKETLVVAKQKEIVRAQEAANDELNEWYDRYCADVSFLTRLVGRQAVISPYTVPQKLSRKFGYGVDDVQPMFEYGYDLATELKSETGTGSTQTYPNPRYKSTSSEKKPYEVSEEDRPGFDAAYIEEYETLFNEEANALEELPIEDQKKILVGIHKKAQQAAVDWYFENHTTE